MRFQEYSGMSYQQASREAERLVERGWFKNFERLAALKEIMILMRKVEQLPEVSDHQSN